MMSPKEVSDWVQGNSNRISCFADESIDQEEASDEGFRICRLTLYTSHKEIFTEL